MLFFSALISGLLQLISHLAVKLYAPRLGLVPRYVMGTVAILLPPTLFLGWDAARPFWICATASGAAVVIAMWIGKQIESYRDQHDALVRAALTEQEARKLLQSVLHAKTEEED